MISVTIEDIVASLAERLQLRWVAGKAGSARKIVAYSASELPAQPILTKPNLKRVAAERRSIKQLSVGFLNLIHPNQIQIIGSPEYNYLNSLRDISRSDAIQQVFNHNPCCIVVTEDLEPLQKLSEHCENADVPLLSSPLPGDQIVENLRYYLANRLAQTIVIHGVYMEVMSIGVLLTGDSGVGKSELALELITRGHRLIADDAPEFSKIAPDIIDGRCPAPLVDFLEVRGLGILNVRELFGAGALRGNKYLRMIIRLERIENASLANFERLETSYLNRNILGLEIPEIILPVAPGRNLAVLVECAARNQILKMTGYNSLEDFNTRQKKLMNISAHP